MDLGLAGKLCVVAGASRGIGRAIANALAREGGRVAAIARGEAELVAAVGALPGGPHVAIAADVATADGATAAIERAAAQLGGIDIAIAVVGKSFARTWGPPDRPIASAGEAGAREASAMTDDDLARSLDANLWSAARVAQRAVPHLIARGGGSITLIASIWGREAGGAPGYNVAKAGVIALAKALARDLARHGIRVNSVAPGSILFPGGGWDRRQRADPEGIADMIRRELPFGRFGTPEEVADAVAFVASPRASWIAGTCLVVDGGQSHAF
ncbi:MAG TPA: SDR family oxidoreductase [Kofleriaceae bacterium]|nr:SDR family oxidoreductase [Kofleriaceae bacterium]